MLSRPTNSATAEEELTGRLRQDRVARRMASKPKCHETMTTTTTPFLIVEHVAQMRALYDTAIALTVKFEDIPRVAPCDRIELASLAEGFWNITVHFSSSRRPTFPPPCGRQRSRWVRRTSDEELQEATAAAERRAAAALRITRVSITIELTAEEAEALAQMCSRFNNDVAERLADRHDGAKERDHILHVISILRRELGAEGFMPR